MVDYFEMEELREELSLATGRLRRLETRLRLSGVRSGLEEANRVTTRSQGLLAAEAVGEADDTGSGRRSDEPPIYAVE